MKTLSTVNILKIYQGTGKGRRSNAIGFHLHLTGQQGGEGFLHQS